LYTYLLFKNRHRINKPVEERIEDEEILGIIFLWDPYKPSFWYFEVVETARRLLMTGVLSTIQPGTFTQLTAGLMMGSGYTAILCFLQPYQEARDNNIAILSSALIELTFIASYLMKSQKLVEDGYEAKGMGAMLVAATVVIIILFLAWAWNAMRDLNRSSTTQVKKVLASRFASTRSKKSSTRSKAENEDIR